MKGFTLIVCGALALTGCMPPFVPPGPAPVRSPTNVSASYDKTWESVITFFANKNIPIRTIEKVSGIIVAEPGMANLQNRLPLYDKNGKVRMDPHHHGYPLQSPPQYADCGSMGDYQFDPTSAVYNIRVLGDASRSSVQVNVRYLSTNFLVTEKPLMIDCSSTGRWEEEIQTFIKERAEKR